jgi:hypothetical protein
MTMQPSAHAGSSLADFSTIKMESIRSSETSVYIRSTQLYVTEGGILQFLNWPECSYPSARIALFLRCISHLLNDLNESVK